METREDSEKDKASIRTLLKDYHRNCLSENLNLPSSSMSCLTERIDEEILNNLEYIDSPNFFDGQFVYTGFKRGWMCF